MKSRILVVEDERTALQALGSLLCVEGYEVFTPECIDIPALSRSSNDDWLSGLPFREGYWQVIRKVQLQLLKSALAEASGNKAEAARALGIQRRLLYEKLTEFGLN
jgi:DNA-binding NtrC family response regulator